jgi:hypothetical protein
MGSEGTSILTGGMVHYRSTNQQLITEDHPMTDRSERHSGGSPVDETLMEMRSSS